MSERENKVSKYALALAREATYYAASMTERYTPSFDGGIGLDDYRFDDCAHCVDYYSYLRAIHLTLLVSTYSE